jgi:hypothetical protein
LARALLIWLSCLLAPLAARADGLAALQLPPDLTVHYDLYTGGLRTLGIEAKARLGADSYALSADINSIGLLGWFISYHARHESGGVLTQSGIHPALYANFGEWNGGRRSVTLSYGPDGPIAAEIKPAAEKDEREPVSPELWAGTVDPLSLVLWVNQQAAGGSPCAVNVPVFDGRRRYNVRLEALGNDTLKATGYSSFAGPALKCRAVWERVAGEPKNPQWQPKRPPLTTVWLAQFGRRGLWLPVRLETESGFGHVIGHMTSVATLRSAEHAAD